MNNCFDKPCVYHGHDLNKFDSYCFKLKCTIEDYPDGENCEAFELAETCLDCKHSRETVYETGTIDDIEYRCPFQNNKLIYDDSSPYHEHYNDIPKCNVGKFELIGEY